MRTPHWTVALACLAWGALIYTLSSFSFSTQGLFAWIRSEVLTDPTDYRMFVSLWQAIWPMAAKTLHLAEYAILLILTTLAIDWLIGNRTSRNLLFATVICILYATSDEWHQASVANRNGTVFDVFVDATGVLLGGYYLLHGRRANPPSGSLSTTRDNTSGEI